MSLPWHPRNHQDALDGMLLLTLEERGAYNTILDLIYQRSGPVPDDERWLAGWMGCSVKKWRLIRAALLVKGKLTACGRDGQPALMNERARLELESASTRRRVAAESGAKGGRKTAQTNTKPNENNSTEQATLEGSLKLYTETDTEQENLTPTIARAPDEIWVERLAEAQALAGQGVDLTSPAVHQYADLRLFCEPGSGEPCTWPEVLDAIRACAASSLRRHKPIRSWTWLKDYAYPLRDRRLAGAPDVQAVARDPPRTTITDQLADEHRRARELTLQALKAANG